MRVDLIAPWPDGYRALDALDKAVTESGFDRKLLELAMLRASQINGCAFCIDMHSKNARALGEEEHRLYALNGWRETAFFTPKEQAALLFAEALTRVADAPLTDDVVEAAREHFDDSELAQLTFGIALTNAWNRVALTMRPEVGTYRSRLGRQAG